MLHSNWPNPYPCHEMAHMPITPQPPVRCRVICLRQSLAWESQEAQNVDNFKYRTQVSHLEHGQTKNFNEKVNEDKLKIEMGWKKETWAEKNPPLTAERALCPLLGPLWLGGFNTAVKMQFRRNERTKSSRGGLMMSDPRILAEIQSLSDIVTTSGPGQNSRNIQ